MKDKPVEEWFDALGSLASAHLGRISNLEERRRKLNQPLVKSDMCQVSEIQKELEHNNAGVHEGRLQ